MGNNYNFNMDEIKEQILSLKENTGVILDDLDGVFDKAQFLGYSELMDFMWTYTDEYLKIVKNEGVSIKSIEDIAENVLKIYPLKTRHSDELDFYDLSVWSIKKALIEAYNLGRNGG